MTIGGGSFKKSLCRNAAAIETGATDCVALDERNFHPR